MVGFLGRLCLRIAGLFLFFLLIFSGAAFAVEPLLLKEDFNGEFIGLHVLHFEDKSRKLTIDDVKSPEYKVKFAPENQTTLNFGFSDSDHWLYFPVKNADSKNVRWLLQLEDPRINLAEAYEETADGGYRAHFSGGQLPVGIRDVKNRKNVFVFDTRPGTSGVFVRVVSPGKTFTNVFMTAWNEKEFTDKNVLESLLLGAFYGSMLGLLLYNFFIFLTVRD
ncbi:MAG: hypothetical protein HY280_01655, partial [Nitrospinae bacterium]|nr:hypothetical protein [Nitrospinota bacterium]